MSLSKIRVPLQDLLRMLVFENSPRLQNHELRDRVVIHYPFAVLEREGLEEGTALLLGAKEGQTYERCLRHMKAEWHDGDLEYLENFRDVRKLLDELIVSVWLKREKIKRSELISIVNEFIASNARPKRTWTVAWEIHRLTVSDDSILKVAGVEFFRLNQTRVREWFGEDDNRLTDLYARSIDRAFGCATVRAGSAKRAIYRARPLILDALDVLRIVLSQGMWSWPESLGQSIGDFRMARVVDSVAEKYWAFGREGSWLDATIDHESLNKHEIYESEKGVRKTPIELAKDLSFPFEPVNKSGLADRLARATLLVGSSYNRSRFDDSVIDLCVSLETLLSTIKDRRKAEAIAARYWLLLSAAGVSAATTHPLELYDLYLLRNEIVHGNGRSVSTKVDVDRLRFAADATIDCVRELMIINQRVRGIQALFTHIQTRSAIERALSHPDLQDPRDSPVAVSGLLREWLDGGPYDSNCYKTSEQ